MKILLCVLDLDYRGTQRCVKECAVVYRRAGHAVFIYAYVRGGEIADELRAEQFEVFIGKDQLSQCMNFMPDVVHIHRNSAANAYETELIQRFKGIGSKVIETSVFGFLDYSEGGRLLDLSLHISLWDLYRWNNWKGCLKRYGVYLPYIVATEEMVRADEAAIQQYRASLGIPKDAFVIGRIGKTQWSSIEQHVYPVLKSSPNVYFLSVGDYNASDMYKSWESDVQSRVVMIPRLRRHEISLFYSGCTVTLNLSPIGESFGFVIAEAMSCGTPVVSVSTPRFDNAQVELIQHGIGGFVAPSITELDPMLRELIAQPSKVEAVQKNCRRLICERYSRDVVGPWLNDIVEIVNRHSGAEMMRKLEENGYVTQVPSKTILSSLCALYRPSKFATILLMRILHNPFVHLARVGYWKIRWGLWEKK